MTKVVFDARDLIRVSLRSDLRSGPFDWGYLVHCKLREAFTEARLQPFSIENEGGKTITVLAYSDRLPTPPSYDHGVMEVASKEMPSRFSEGARYRYRVRVCPVVRRTVKRPDGTEDGNETDAFLASALGRPKDEPVVREAVYRDWLHAAVRRIGGADLRTVRMTSFRLVPILRRDRERRVTRREQRKQRRPDAVFEGILEVTDSERFRTLLARGIGRHRAFGFGMLLLKPA